MACSRVGAQFDDDLNSDVLKGATTLDALRLLAFVEAGWWCGGEM